MAGGSEKQGTIAAAWAEALIELAAQDGREDAVLDELVTLVELYDADPELESILASPLTGGEIKRALLEKALRGRASDLLVDALQVMRRKGRLDMVRAIAVAYRVAWLRRKKRVEVRVTSAVPLSESLREELVRVAARRTAREPMLVERVDPELLGGLVVSIEDQKFDGSVATELTRIESSLLERGSRELMSEKSYVTEDQ